MLYNVACVHSLAGMGDEAIACLDKAVRNGFGHRAWLDHDTDLNPLREDPRFRAILQRL